MLTYVTWQTRIIRENGNIEPNMRITIRRTDKSSSISYNQARYYLSEGSFKCETLLFECKIFLQYPRLSTVVFLYSRRYDESIAIKCNTIK